MTEARIILSGVFIVAGVFFILVSSIGIIRLPDFYSRTHATSKGDTLGIICVITGLILFEGFTQNSLKLFLISLFAALANPIGAHAIAKAAFSKGIKPLFTDGTAKKEVTK